MVYLNLNDSIFATLISILDMGTFVGIPSPQAHASWEAADVEEDPSPAKRPSLVRGDHDYDDGLTLMYRSEEDSPNEYESSSPSEEEKFTPWQTVIRYGINQKDSQHPAHRAV